MASHDMARFVMGIDPGVSGGLAWVDDSGEVHACAIPDTRKDLSHLLRTLNGQRGLTLVEKVGTHVKGNNASSSVTFGRVCERVEMGLDCHDYRWDHVQPTVWMRFLLKGAPPKDHTARKNAIKAVVQRLYPTIKVTLKTADALGILTYALSEANKRQYQT